MNLLNDKDAPPFQYVFLSLLILLLLRGHKTILLVLPFLVYIAFLLVLPFLVYIACMAEGLVKGPWSAFGLGCARLA